MPLISTIGAASSRGFGEFSQQNTPKYIENYFSTTLYTGSGSTQNVTTNVPLLTTSSWGTYKIAEGASKIFAVTVDASGNFYVTGTAVSAGSNYALVVKYDSNGNLVWNKKYGTSAYGYNIAVDTSGNVFVVGNVGTEALLLKYDSTGSLIFQRTLGRTPAAETVLRGICLDSSGNIYVCGTTQAATSRNGLFAKYNNSGTLQFKYEISDLASYDSIANKITIDSSSNLYITYNGIDNTASFQYQAMLKFNSSGTLLLSRKLYSAYFSGSPFITNSGIAVDSSGNIYITSKLSSYASLIKLDSSGAVVWYKSFTSITDYMSDIKIDSSGNIYAVTDGSTTNSGYVFKFSSSGSVLWQSSILQGTSGLNGVAIDSSGNLFVSGFATSGSTYGFTSKLTQSGSTTFGTAFVSLSPTTYTTSNQLTTSNTTSPTVSSSGTVGATPTSSSSNSGATSSFASQAPISGSGLVWIKGRSTTSDHALYDTERGATFDIASNLTTGQTTESTGLTSFLGDGFTIGSLAKINTGTVIYTSWTFREQAKFFDVVTYTGNGANRTIAHNLGSVPGMIIIKRTDTNASWAVYHRGLSNTEYLVLNTQALKSTGTTYWNSTTPTSTVFSLGTATDVNGSGGTYVAYLFAHDAGGFGLTGSDNVISCGTYTTNASGVATVTLGWEPQFVISKIASGVSAADWQIYDNMRGFSLSSSWELGANLTYADSNMGATFYPTPTGFVDNGSTAGNATFIYVAIRRGPMNIPTDATTIFQPTVYTGTNANNRLINTTIAPDMAWIRQRNSTTLGGMVVGDRLRGQPYLLTGTTAAEVTSATAFDQQKIGTTEYGTAFSSMNGVWVGIDATAQLNVSTTASNQIAEAFKRAPGFFDVVAYTGTGSNTTITHNLGAVPELMLIKRRASTNAWAVYSAGIDNTEYLVLNTTAGKASGTTYWNSTTPTSTVFSLGTAADVNTSTATYVAYLFASCPGVSKVGSYTGTGTTQQINCGFTSGARFVLIKRTDSTGDWYAYDTARGIIAANDPYILLNSTAAEVTNTDYVDPYSAGFELSSAAPAGLNAYAGSSWVSRTSQFSTSIIRGLTYGGGLFVAVGDSGKMSTSTDGITWTSRTSGFGTTRILAVAYGNGLYVAVGETGTLTTSTDGVTWTSRTSGFGSASIRAVTYGNGVFVIAGDSGLLSTSTDGITWTSRTSNFGTTYIFSLAYGNGLFVAGGQVGTLATSTDGITWTLRTSNFGANTINGITYGNGLFVAGGGAGEMSTSSDGVTWTARTSGFSSNAIRAVTYVSPKYIAVGDTGTITSSSDGITWSAETSGTSALQAAASSQTLVASGGNAGYLITSTGGNYIYLAIA